MAHRVCHLSEKAFTRPAIADTTRNRKGK
ncbi:hypothetical protein P5673_004554 [Acropora cervicornis]|uniref:Uncharacterized protein n=1 Tax=Acropora cervicornis TaxID=6130 RepID=A0AAD9R0I2_ACRCE|nr:hypothetical protein P5673_004554 [Acropora cervicornis]